MLVQSCDRVGQSSVCKCPFSLGHGTEVVGILLHRLSSVLLSKFNGLA